MGTISRFGSINGCMCLLRDFKDSMNEGIWSIYYFILFLCLMIMWKPSENSAAYAYHNELATDVQEDEEYGLPQDKLIVAVLRDGHV